MLAAMPFNLFNEWSKFDQVEPLDPAPRLEWMLANLTALMYNMWRGKDTEALTADDFIPRREPVRDMTPEDKKALLNFWALDLKIKTGQYKPPEGTDQDA